MIAALVLFAAIITEQNDLYTATTDAATFGSNSTGIASMWIPFGTFTGGTGGTEIMRVTSNLVGVVASVFDGYEERKNVPQEYLPTEGGYHYCYTFPPVFNTWAFYDDGTYLRTTNQTTRIADAINSSRLIAWYHQGTNYTYYINSGGHGENIEHRLAYSYIYPGDEDDRYSKNEGLATSFGSRRLDALVGELGGISPPIGESWTSEIPFKTSDTSAWVLTWPTYAGLTNDIHFFTGSTDAWQRVSFPFMSWLWPSHLYPLWGDDTSEAAYAVETNAYDKPLPIQLEDVLKVDPGWRYDVPATMTGEYYAVSGPIGPFRLDKVYDGGTRSMWDNSATASNMYVRLMLSEGVHEGVETYDIAFEIMTNGATIVNIEGTAGRNDDPILIDDLDSIHDYSARHVELWADTDDFANWRNYTTRLDWKRLGILCQLERHMEETYRTRDGEDYLPCQRVSAIRTKSWTGTKVLDVPMPETLPYETDVELKDIAWVYWTNTVNVTTNHLDWNFPTARAARPTIGGSVSGGGNANGFNFSTGWSILLGVEDLAGLIESCSGLTNAAPADFQAYIDIQVKTYPLRVTVQLVDCWEILSDGWEWVQLGNSDTIALDPGTPTNFVALLTRSISKYATHTWTRARLEDENMIITNWNETAAYPATNIWARNYVARQSRPSLDFMIWGDGDVAGQYVWNLNAMDWGNMEPYHPFDIGRAWRMNPYNSPATTLYGSNYTRLTMMRDLDAAVKTKFGAVAGFGVTQVEERTEINAAEEAAIKANLEGKNVHVVFQLLPWDFRAKLAVDMEQPWFNPTNYTIEQFYEIYGWSYMTNHPPGEHNDATPWLQASMNVRDGRVEDLHPYAVKVVSQDAGALTADGDIVVAEAFYNVYDVAADAITNEYRDVSVDGHQDTMIQTLWRFKNLRDPNL